MVYYSREDYHALFYIAIFLIPIIGLSLIFGSDYNERQVVNKLAGDGVKLHVAVSDICEVEAGRGPNKYYAVLDYSYKGKHFNNAIEINNGYCQIGDSVILNRLIDNDSETYMRIVGVKSNGVYLLK